MVHANGGMWNDGSDGGEREVVVRVESELYNKPHKDMNEVKGREVVIL
jgi:hypothetical protein